MLIAFETILKGREKKRCKRRINPEDIIFAEFSQEGGHR
jgi:hypothetical protein